MKNSLRNVYSPNFKDIWSGHHVLIRNKDRAVSCAYKNQYCKCSKRWYKNRNYFKSIHGLEY